MTEEEIVKRFCKFELCTHRNGEGTCCLYNQDNCIFHTLEKENAELKNKLTEKVTLESLDVVSARMDDLEKEAKQSYLDNTDHMQWDVEGEFDYTRGYLNGAEPREKRIEELEMTVGTLRTFNNEQAICIERLEKENAELKATLTAGSMFNKSLNADNKYLTEERDKYRNMVFDTKDQLAQAKEIIKDLLEYNKDHWLYSDIKKQAEQFLKEEV